MDSSLDDTQVKILSLAAIIGVFDTDHLKHLNLSRCQHDQALGQLEHAGAIARLDVKNLRAGRRGRPPHTFALTEEGAVLAQRLGRTQAHAYGQDNAAKRAHDICTLDVRLAAEAAGLGVATERVLQLDGHTIRPDNTITLSNSQVVMFETEGPASSRKQRARLVKKVMAYNTAAPALREAGADLNVRVLFNQSRNDDRKLLRTEETWTQAIATVCQDVGGQLDVYFWSKPLSEFLKTPVWDTVKGFCRLDDPSRAPGFGLAPPLEGPDADILEMLRWPVVAPGTREFLQARGRYNAAYILPQIRSFSPEFFEVMCDIYNVAFPRDVDIGKMLTIPVSALLMLRAYIQRNPELHRALHRAGQRFQRSTSVILASHEANQLARAFLNFHGLRHDHPACQVEVTPPSLSGGHPYYSVHAQVKLDDDKWGSEKHISAALAWVLQRMLDYPEVLGIDQPPESN